MDEVADGVVGPGVSSRGSAAGFPGLLSWDHVRARAAELIESETAGVAVLWMDLDGFKEVNDRFGHRAGDLVLVTISSRLHLAAREHHMVGRLGGDVFAMLVTGVADAELDELAGRILGAVRAPIRVHETVAFVSTSMGVAVYPRDGRSAVELLHNADTAMYVAKDRGGDRYVHFAPPMNEAADERAAMRQRLGAALNRNDFEMHYQPIVEVATGRVSMVESLVRWNRGNEVVPAADFIDHAVQTGRMRALGRVVLRLVDQDMRTMSAALGDRRPRVAVNLSVTELAERDITDWLLAWAPAGGLGGVVTEVTESVLLGRGSRAMETLVLLRSRGATISIDDFGTGYSNLELLDRLDPGIIKIDRSLSRRAREDDRGLIIVRAAIDLAHALQAQVVLEGVEDEAMLSMAQAQGADHAQGFHIARPMPVGEVIEWIARRI